MGGPEITVSNALEDLSYLFQREVLDQIGFAGPYPHALARQIDSITVDALVIHAQIKAAIQEP